MLTALLVAASLAATPAEDSLASARRADSLRVAILSAARFVQLDASLCQQGALRTFPDSARAPGSASATELLARLERLVIAEGVEEPIQTPRGFALLRGVIAWETGADRPLWDVPEGAATLPAIAAGLSGEYWNPDAKRCEPFVPDEPQYVLLPELDGFTMPRPRRTPLTIGFGERGLYDLRDKFFSSHRGDSTAVMTYTHVIATVLWRDYAVVAVNRPAEQMGAMALRRSAGGATYLFHFADGEWRLLAIVRTWT